MAFGMTPRTFAIHQKFAAHDARSEGTKARMLEVGDCIYMVLCCDVKRKGTCGKVIGKAALFRLSLMFDLSADSRPGKSG
jgi:hypothetical protein